MVGGAALHGARLNRVKEVSRIDGTPRTKDSSNCDATLLVRVSLRLETVSGGKMINSMNWTNTGHQKSVFAPTRLSFKQFAIVLLIQARMSK